MNNPNAALCPTHITESIDAYVEHGQPTGGFLEAVLSNDLRESVGRADYVNRPLIPHIVAYLYNCVPSDVWGSPEAVKRHIAKKRAEREARTT